MEIGTSRFGSLQISSDDRLCFPNGLPGFEDCRDWVLLIERADHVLGWLQSVSWPDLAIPVVDPQQFVSQYEVRLDPAELLPLGLARADDTQILGVVARHGNVLTVNLKAPLAINMRRRLGRQVINNAEWPVDYAVKMLPSLIKKSA